MKLLLYLLFIIIAGNTAFCQQANKIITAAEVGRIENILSADDMMGRRPFTPGIEKAASFITTIFKKAGLQFLDTATSYLQNFNIIRTKFIAASGQLDGAPITADKIIAITTTEKLDVNETSGYAVKAIAAEDDLQKAAASIVSSGKRTIVFVSEAHSAAFTRLKRFKRDGFDERQPVIFVLNPALPAKFSFEITHEVSRSLLQNVVGMIPGKSRKDEYVIFSAHYDHLGIGKPNAAGDSIYNGANDDASGTTAVMMLANYFAKQKNNERTLVFVAFTAEESGGYGSRYFSSVLNPDKIVAMFNIEMIGTESKWGTNSAYITGYEKSDFGTILQKNLAGSAFKFEPDPYPKQNLFYRSDNATLAALGVPAHTISTSKMDSEKFYHTQEDEVETLDMQNMAEIIKAIALSSKGIVAGKETPSRIEKLQR